MASIWAELKRRNVVKVAVAYAVVGWLLIEVASVLMPTFQAPEWVMRVFSFAIIAGFPLAVVLAWAFDITPEGIKSASTAQASESNAKGTGRKLEFAIIGALVLTLGFVVYNYVLEDEPVDAIEVTASVLPNSVAVLPLENLSPDPDDAYFAAGMHEEILNHLAKLRNLNVISRTSVIRYADSDLSVPEIADELNVETVMEGSVRYANDRVLVTIQLIDPESDVHLWSESYNRDLSDVFAIQADIAMNVANSLEAEFSLAEQESIEAVPTDSPQAYALYLRATTGARFLTSMDNLDQAIELDPEFALAYATKAYWHAESLEGAFANPAEAAALMPVVRENAERALALDPTIGIAHSALANLNNVSGNLAEAEAAYASALEVSPNDPHVMALYSRFKRYIGEYDDAIRLSERSVTLGPNDQFPNTQLAFNYWYAHDYAEAVAAFQRGVELDAASGTSHAGLGFTEVSRGNYDEALRELQIAEQLQISSLRFAQYAFAYGQMGRTEDAARFFSMLQDFSREEPVAEATWAMAYFAIADYDEAYRRLENAVSSPLAGEQIALSELKANAYGDPMLDEPRWRELRDRIGQL